MFSATNPLVPSRLRAKWHVVRRLLESMRIVVSHMYKEDDASADRLTRVDVEDLVWWSSAGQLF